MDLHRAGKHSDWQNVSEAKRNWWQKQADRTHGLVTPGNIVSAFGALLVAASLVYFLRGSWGWGLILLFAGRLADVADGIVAACTHTKSPIGEAVDAALDKFTLLGALIVFVVTGIVPILAILLIAIFNGANAAFGLLARARKHSIHPSQLGKITAVFQWLAILVYVLAAVLSSGGFEVAAAIATSSAVVSLLISLILGLFTVAGYAIDAKNGGSK
jgi:phosphatidylglycerophosphate synthase